LKRLLPLAAIEVLVWALMLIVMFLISRVAFAINIGVGTLPDRIATQIARSSLSVIVVVIWLLAWKKITDVHFWRALARKRTTSQKSFE
jgi:hypothetical protein